jgi:hypothetical protein
MKILPIIETIEVTKSKKDNIHCLFLKFNSKFFGIDNHQYNIDFDENGKKIVTLDLYIGDTESDEDNCLGRFELDITSIWTQYEYPHYDIHKSKEEIFIYFYEYPHKENEVEFLNSEVKNVGFFPKKSA